MISDYLYLICGLNFIFFLREFVKILIGVQNRQIYRLSDVVMRF
jgi:hypothetical protein